MVDLAGIALSVVCHTWNSQPNPKHKIKMCFPTSHTALRTQRCIYLSTERFHKHISECCQWPVSISSNGQASLQIHFQCWPRCLVPSQINPIPTVQTVCTASRTVYTVYCIYVFHQRKFAQMYHSSALHSAPEWQDRLQPTSDSYHLLP